MSTDPILETRDLHVGYRVYKGFLKVVNGVNITVQKAEKVGLVGEAGCGKTTTMKSVMRVLPIPPGHISKGEVLFKGKDLLRVDFRKVRGVEGLSMIFQDPTAALNPTFTIGTQLMDVIKYSENKGHKTSETSSGRDRAIQILRDVAMPDPERIMRNYPIQLSGGMRQRVCIGIALMCARDLLIADEPGTSLDVTIQDQIHRLLQKLVEEKGLAIILITHSLGVVREMTDRVYVMYAGDIVETAKTKELFADPLHPYTQGLLASIPKLTGGAITMGIEGRIPDYLNPPIGCRFYPRCKDAMAICKREKSPLFDVGNGHQVACFLRGRR